ncbi:MAG: branched-chain amino acid ABC transporter permease [Caldimicrobium sp.]
MEIFLQFFLSGVTVGAIYALIALGFNIVYNTTSILNLAQGEFVVLGGLFMWLFFQKMELPYYISFFLTLLTAGIFAFLMERLTIKPLLKTGDPLLLILITIAFSILLKGLLMFIFGKDPYGYPPLLEGMPILLGGAVIQKQVLVILAFILLTMIFLYFFFNKTILGKAMKACAFDQVAAQLMGINISRMVMLSFVLSGIFAALAGILITPITFMEYDRGAILTIKAFTASILGGLGSIWGAIAGGFILGIAENLVAGYIHSGLKDAISLVLLLIMLLLKPAGLFQKEEEVRLKKL